jgi:hypothetical protein
VKQKWLRLGEACPFTKIKFKGRYEKMIPSQKATHSTFVGIKIALFTLFLVCGIATSASAQETMKGTFALTAEARLGSTVLPAGQYTVLVQPVTPMTAPDSRVLVFVRPNDKSGPVASVFALASQQGCEIPSGLKLVSSAAGLVARSLCLGKQGIMIDFDQSRPIETPKIKATVASLRP